MNFQQGELPLFGQPIPFKSRKADVLAKQQPISKPCYKTTQEVVKLLKLKNAKPLYSARHNQAAYRLGYYVVVLIGQRNQWEVFRRYSA